MKLNKNILYIFLIILIIFGIIIYKKMIKKNNIGNNMSSQGIVDYILNCSSYKANIEVQVTSNKNKNKYIIKQEYDEGKSIQEIIEPSNIEGVKIIKENDNLKIENTNLKLSQIFENYKGLEENALDLISFIENYNNNNTLV